MSGENAIENLARGGLPSASKMTRIFHCPASFSLNQGELPQPSSEVAAEGTLLHKVCELAAYPTDEEAQEERQKIEATLTPEQMSAVEFALEKLAEIQKRFKEKYGNYDVDAERRLELQTLDGKLLMSGKGDYIGYGGNRAFIIDYKFGRGYVEPAERNMQLAAMAALVWREYDVEAVDVYIIQPRAESAERRITAAVYGLEDLKTATQAIKEACFAALYADNPQQSVGYWCKFCESKYRCAAAQKVMDDESALVAKGFEITPENVREIFEKAKFVGKMCVDIIKRCGEVVSANPDLETGLYFAPNSPTRSIPDTLGALRVVEEKLGRELTDGELCRLVQFKIGELEKFFTAEMKAANPDAKITKKALAEAFGKALKERGLIEYSAKAPSLKVKE